MTDADRVEAAKEIWSLMYRTGRDALSALYEFERLALDRLHPKTEPCPPPDAE